MINQGFSGSTVRKVGDTVEKETADRAFIKDARRQTDLMALSRRLRFLPEIRHVHGGVISMAFIQGREGLTRGSALEAGRTLRELHDQKGFRHPCRTGIQWLVELANENLAGAGRKERISSGLSGYYSPDALIHAEPSQYIQQPDGQIVFIDIEETGWGSRYRDLGFIDYISEMSGDRKARESFMRGYTTHPIKLETNRIRQVAGLTALAYARFANTERRLSTGLKLMRQAGLENAPSAFE